MLCSSDKMKISLLLGTAAVPTQGMLTYCVTHVGGGKGLSLFKVFFNIIYLLLFSHLSFFWAKLKLNFFQSSNPFFFVMLMVLQLQAV